MPHPERPGTISIRKIEDAFVAPWEPPRSTPHPQTTTNMSSFFVFCGARLSGRQTEGVAGALQLGPQGEVVLVEGTELGRRRGEFWVCQSPEYLASATHKPPTSALLGSGSGVNTVS